VTDGLPGDSERPPLPAHERRKGSVGRSWTCGPPVESDDTKSACHNADLAGSVEVASADRRIVACLAPAGELALHKAYSNCGLSKRLDRWLAYSRSQVVLSAASCPDPIGQATRREPRF
jgi:hypothetical protein